MSVASLTRNLKSQWMFTLNITRLFQGRNLPQPTTWHVTETKKTLYSEGLCFVPFCRNEIKSVLKRENERPYKSKHFLRSPHFLFLLYIFICIFLSKWHIFFIYNIVGHCDCKHAKLVSEPHSNTIQLKKVAFRNNLI